MFCLPDIISETKYFCRMSLVMYLVYYNYSNAGHECQASSGTLFSSGFERAKLWQYPKS